MKEIIPPAEVPTAKMSWPAGKWLWLKLHLETIWFLSTTVVPLMLRTAARPVLFTANVGIGDLICTLPAAAELKKRHSRAAFIFHCPQEFACLPPMGGITSITVTKNVHPDMLKKYWFFVFSAVYSFVPQNFSSADFPIVDYGRKYGVIAQAEHPYLKINPNVLKRVLLLLDEKGISKQRLIALHRGPSWPVRSWPLNNWAELAIALNQLGFTNIVCLGIGKYMHGKVPVQLIPGTQSLVDQLTLEESIAFLSLCDLLIGIDSGLLHIAAALRRPAIGLFGPTSPHFRFSPKSSCSFVVSRVECQGCHHRLPCLHWITGCPYEIKCMKTILVSDVLTASLARLTLENFR